MGELGLGLGIELGLGEAGMLESVWERETIESRAIHMCKPFENCSTFLTNCLTLIPTLTLNQIVSHFKQTVTAITSCTLFPITVTHQHRP